MTHVDSRGLELPRTPCRMEHSRFLPGHDAQHDRNAALRVHISPVLVDRSDFPDGNAIIVAPEINHRFGAKTISP